MKRFYISKSLSVRALMLKLKVLFGKMFFLGIITAFNIFSAGCLKIVIPKELDCEVSFEYVYHFDQGTLVSGSFEGIGSTFEYTDVPVTEKILTSKCPERIPTGEVENIYPEIRLRDMYYASNYRELLLIGPNNIGGWDQVTFLVDANGTVYKELNGQPQEQMGQLTFDIPNQKMKYSGTHPIKLQLGED